jgi:erythromycin esterase-like protein
MPAKIDNRVVETIVKSALSLGNLPTDYTPILNTISHDTRVVMIGEASHGTEDFYRHRAEITKRLIEEKGFNIIALEADWPDCHRITKYVKGYRSSMDKNANEALGYSNFFNVLTKKENLKGFPGGCGETQSCLTLLTG